MTSPDKEGFLQRWSRLKRAADQAPGASPQDASAGVPEPPPPALADAEKLDFSSDFTPFLRAKVEESVKRAALKKLFHSPHFNQMDGLDVYIDDYGKFEPLDDATLSQLAHARELLFREQSDHCLPAAEGSAPGDGTVTGGSAGDPPPTVRFVEAGSSPAADAADAPGAGRAGSDNR